MHFFRNAIHCFWLFCLSIFIFISFLCCVVINVEPSIAVFVQNIFHLFLCCSVLSAVYTNTISFIFVYHFYHCLVH